MVTALLATEAVGKILLKVDGIAKLTTAKLAVANTTSLVNAA